MTMSALAPVVLSAAVTCHPRRQVTFALSAAATWHRVILDPYIEGGALMPLALSSASARDRLSFFDQSSARDQSSAWLWTRTCRHTEVVAAAFRP
jgi:hypothetical protein